MKKRYTLASLFVLLSLAVNAQLTGITPNQGVHMQTLQTTITSNGLFIQSSSPGGNIYDIKLTKGGDVITVFEYWNWNTNINVVDANTVTIDMTIPYSVGAGVYDLGVTTGDVWDPTWNQSFYTLPGAFTVLPPDGYVTGTVYDDLNKNGVKDAGEPGISGQSVKLLPLNYTLISDVNGNYSFPVANGNYSVTSSVVYTNYMFLTSPNDTIPVTVNNNTAANNDFGYKYALTSITPNTGYRGISTTHQLVADEPIFIPGANPWGNITNFRVLSSPNVTVNTSTSVTVIDSFTVQVAINIPANVTAANNLDIRIFTSSGYYGYHYLNDQFNIVTPPAFVSGTLFFDQNQNKINDVGEPKLSGGKVVMAPDGSTAFSDYYGNFLVGSMVGPQTLTYMNNMTGLVLFTDSASYTFNATPGNITGKDFGFQSTQPDYSIQVSNTSLFARCNTQQYAYFRVRNTSNIFYNAKAWIKFGPNMSFVSSTLPTTVSNDTVYWDLTNLAPYSEILLKAKFQLPGAGSTVNLNYGASSLDGSNTAQLTGSVPASYWVFCAWDPNDKQVTPPGIFAQNYTLMTDTLEYLIRFQNTGNDTAFNVVVLDTLDSNLDFNTFEILGSSHSMQTELESNGALRFTFNNILLVDSNANEPESHGYIRYSIRANTGLPDGTPVNNTAHIFFDFNPAVVTNTTLNTMVYVLPVGIDETGAAANRVLLYPNPFNQSATLSFYNPGSDKFILSLSEITGKNVAPGQSTTGSRFVIEKNKLSKGIYFYNLRNTVTDKLFTGKFIVE